MSGMNDTAFKTHKHGRFLKFFHLEKSMFSKEECEKIISFYKSKTYKQAGVVDRDKSKGNDIKSTFMENVRKGHLVFAQNTDTELQFAFDRLHYAAIWANFGWGILPLKFFQLAEYDADTDGGFYKRHRDIILDQNPQRIISVVVQLSPRDSYAGCNLVFDHNSELPKSSEFAEQGDAIFFLSVEPHEVTPVTSGVRYSLTGWFTGPPCWTKETLPSNF